MKKTNLLLVTLLLLGQHAFTQTIPPVQVKTETNADIEQFEINKAKAENGDPEAQDKLGLCYEFGKGVAKDEVEAAKWFRKAADSGSAAAERSEGIYYLGMNTADGTPDYVEAAKWFRKAADQNDAFAELCLGDCYADGKGVPHDYPEALKWYRNAADQGYAPAECSVGFCYISGIGVPTNFVEAAQWFRKAADQGEADAQYSLGYCYCKGEGVEANAVEGYKWCYLASAQGNEPAKEILSILNQKMTPEQIAEAQRLSMAFQPQTETTSGNSNSTESPTTSAIIQTDATNLVAIEETNSANVAPADDWKTKDSFLQQYRADNPYDPRPDSEILSWAKTTGKLDAYTADQKSRDDSFDQIADQMWGSGALKTFTEAKARAEAGDAKAQKQLGDCYKLVIGAQQDYVEAVKWYRKAAEQGDAPAQFCLGVCYDNGTGVAQDYAEAIKWYQKSFNQGYTEAQEPLTNLEATVQKIQLLKPQAETGDAEAQFSLGSLYEARWRATTNDLFNSLSPTNATLLEAMAWYRKAAEQGNATAQFALADCYWSAGCFLLVDNTPNLTNKDKIEAVKWYRKAAEQGNVKAQLALGDCYQNGDEVSNTGPSFIQAMSQQWIGDGVSKDTVEAVKWYRKAAEQGDEQSQFDLGLSFEAGNGVDRDLVQAYKWFCLAAAHARSDVPAPEGLHMTTEQLEESLAETARSSLNGLLAMGYMTPEQIEEAKQLVSKEAPDAAAKVEADIAADQRKKFEADKLAAENGNPSDQEALAFDYEQGKGVETNLVEAARWYRNAAEQGDASAQTSLGLYYEQGEGVAQDYAEAAKWYRRAADQGDESGQCQLGSIYESGNGVPKDYVEAYKWFNLSAAQGYSIAQSSRDAIAASMTPDQIAEAQQMSREFQPRAESASTNSN